jgi:hypothetical protein
VVETIRRDPVRGRRSVAYLHRTFRNAVTRIRGEEEESVKVKCFGCDALIVADDSDAVADAVSAGQWRASNLSISASLPGFTLYRQLLG